MIYSAKVSKRLKQKINACFTVLSEQANFEQLVKQDKSLAQKVRDFFAEFIDKIKNALKTVAQTNKEYRALQGDIEAKEQILAMFDEALKASDPATKNTTDGSSVRYSKIGTSQDGRSIYKTNYKKIHLKLKSRRILLILCKMFGVNLLLH